MRVLSLSSRLHFYPVDSKIKINFWDIISLWLLATTITVPVVMCVCVLCMCALCQHQHTPQRCNWKMLIPVYFSACTIWSLIQHQWIQHLIFNSQSPLFDICAPHFQLLLTHMYSCAPHTYLMCETTVIVLKTVCASMCPMCI